MVKGSSLGKVCSFPGCNKKNYGLGYCQMHYQRYKKYGDPATVKYEYVYHGKSFSRERYAWRNMISRCSNIHNDHYKYYGGKGISVCSRWMHSFSNFYADMGDCPAGYQIDRINNNGNYEPSNCRWTTPTINMRNRPSVKLSKEKAAEIRRLYLEEGGHTYPSLARLYGVCPSTIAAVVKRLIWRDA